MSENAPKKIGLIVGAEWDWPKAFLTAVNQSDEPVTAEMVKLGGTFMEEPVAYDVIVDRMSHNIPYYREYVKHAAIHGTYIVNNPFIWDTDSKFLGTAVIHKLGLKIPRTVVLPNKEVTCEASPDTFRNLKYPMNWEQIIEYVGVPAIYKDIHSGGRQFASRVHNVDELIQRYDESGYRTTVLQQIIDSDDHLHAFVIGHEDVMILRYSTEKGTYLRGIISKEEGIGQKLADDALQITKISGYDINMVEFVVDNDQIFVINSTNPAPDIDHSLMRPDQFEWCIQKMSALVIERAKRPLPQQIPFSFTEID